MELDRSRDREGKGKHIGEPGRKDWESEWKSEVGASLGCARELEWGGFRASVRATLAESQCGI